MAPSTNTRIRYPYRREDGSHNERPEDKKSRVSFDLILFVLLGSVLSLETNHHLRHRMSRGHLFLVGQETRPQVNRRFHS